MVPRLRSGYVAAGMSNTRVSGCAAAYASSSRSHSARQGAVQPRFRAMYQQHFGRVACRQLPRHCATARMVPSSGQTSAAVLPTTQQRASLLQRTAACSNCAPSRTWLADFLQDCDKRPLRLQRLLLVDEPQADASLRCRSHQLVADVLLPASKGNGGRAGWGWGWAGLQLGGNERAARRRQRRVGVASRWLPAALLQHHDRGGRGDLCGCQGHQWSRRPALLGLASFPSSTRCPPPPAALAPPLRPSKPKKTAAGSASARRQARRFTARRAGVAQLRSEVPWLLCTCLRAGCSPRCPMQLLLPRCQARALWGSQGPGVLALVQHAAMQQPPSDLAFAQAVLEGQVATRGPWHAHRQQDSRGRGRGRSGRGAGQQGGRPQGGRHPGGAAAKRRRHGQQQQEEAAARQTQQLQDAGTSSSGSEDSGSSSSSSSDGSRLAAYNRPGPRSTARAAHCTACDVWVPRRAGDWEVRDGWH